MSFIDNKIISKTGLASSVWNDLTPDNLRKRLESKIANKKLNNDEKSAILRELEALLNKARKELI